MPPYLTPRCRCTLWILLTACAGSCCGCGPVADPGADQEVACETTVTLDGRASRPDTATFSWASSDAAIQLQNPTSPTPTFRAQTEGTFTFTLTVQTPGGARDDAPTRVTVSACPETGGTIASDDGTTIDDCNGATPCPPPAACQIDADCGGARVCSAGRCVGCVTHSDCEDGNPCTAGLCVDGVCVQNDNPVLCDDGDPCTVNDVCSAGACSGQPRSCDDQLGCTIDGCAAGECVFVSTCDSGQTCTASGCTVGTTGCTAASDCDDESVCTADVCDAGSCAHVPIAGGCDDGDPCTTADACSGGVCLGVAMDCDDGNPCTDDTCVAGACDTTANTAPCDDGDACTTADVCAGGACAGTVMDCDDGLACTADACVAGTCAHDDTCATGQCCTAGGCEPCTPHPGNVLCVAAAAPPGGDGSAWPAAFNDLQAALAAAQAGDEIWVATGTYRPAASDREVSFLLKPDVPVYGGFAGTETTRAQRAGLFDQTILSGDIGTPGDPTDNSYHVVNATAGAVTLDGFTVTHGRATGSINMTRAYAGFRARDTQSVTLRNSIITDNYATNQGAGVGIIAGGVAVIEDCTISNNRGSQGSIEGSGGGLTIEQGTSLTMDRCKITGNVCGTGGGLALGGSGTFSVFNTLVADNTATGPGTSGDGGGLSYYAVGPVGQFVNVTIAGNHADGEGGGAYVSQRADFVNCIFTANTQSCLSLKTEDVTDCCPATACVCQDCADLEAVQLYRHNLAVLNPDYVTVTSSFFEDVNPDGPFPGNPTGDAGLDTTTWRIDTCVSPCVDSGDNSALPPGQAQLDCAGAPRVINGTIDLGAHERQAVCP